MTGSPDDLARAQAQALAARARLARTMSEIQERLTPNALFREAWEEVRIRGSELADDVAAAARARPITVAAIIGALLLLVARKPLARFVARLFFRNDATPDGDDRFSDGTAGSPAAASERGDGV